MCLFFPHVFSFSSFSSSSSFSLSEVSFKLARFSFRLMLLASSAWIQVEK